jgi:preprotein translocase subunit SecE
MSTEEKLDSEIPSEQGEDETIGDQLLREAGEPLEAATDEGEAGAGKRTVGVERWVQLGFMVAAILLVWLYDHIINGIWYVFADPNEAVATAGAVVAGIVTAILLYKNATVYGLIHGVAEEMSKVTWPTRKETSSSTIVVVVTSIVAAVMLFLFDSVWAAVTDLVYKV